jgi:ACS family hexuronate transporter-like MFS transporter
MRLAGAVVVAVVISLAALVVSEWFAVRERSIAMGIINAGTAVGNVAAVPLITLVIIPYVDWFGLSSWRWVFFLTGGIGLLWTVWWFATYHPPAEPVPDLKSVLPENESAMATSTNSDQGSVPIKVLLRYREVRGIVFAKFLSDAAWYFFVGAAVSAGFRKRPPTAG